VITIPLASAKEHISKILAFKVLSRQHLSNLISSQTPRTLTWKSMEHFETLLAEATKEGSNGIPGAVVAVVDKSGMSLLFTPTALL
jgi:hypothetical protein